jgi:type II secretion system protein N
MFEGLKKLWIQFKKLRLGLLVFILSTLVFFVMLFPLNDLGDLISAQVSKATQGKVYFQFDGLNLSAWPLGLQMSNVFVEAGQMSALKAKDVTVLPSVSGMLKGKPYGHINASGFLKGDVSLSLSSAPAGEKSPDRSTIDLSAKKISLKELRSLAGLPFFMQGDLNLDMKTIADFTFQDQPEADVVLTVTKFELPPTNVDTSFGPLTMPEVKLKQVDLKGKLSGGTFVIEKGDVGQAGDELQANIKGQIKVTLMNMGGQIVPQLGSYNLDIELKTQKSFQEKAGLFLSFLQAHQTSPGQYKFKVASPQWGVPPQITTLR